MIFPGGANSYRTSGVHTMMVQEVGEGGLSVALAIGTGGPSRLGKDHQFLFSSAGHLAAGETSLFEGVPTGNAYVLGLAWRGPDHQQFAVAYHGWTDGNSGRGTLTVVWYAVDGKDIVVEHVTQIQPPPGGDFADWLYTRQVIATVDGSGIVLCDQSYNEQPEHLRLVDSYVFIPWGADDWSIFEQAPHPYPEPIWDFLEPNVNSESSHVIGGHSWLGGNWVRGLDPQRRQHVADIRHIGGDVYEGFIHSARLDLYPDHFEVQDEVWKVWEVEAEVSPNAYDIDLYGSGMQMLLNHTPDGGLASSLVGGGGGPDPSYATGWFLHFPGEATNPRVVIEELGRSAWQPGWYLNTQGYYSAQDWWGGYLGVIQGGVTIDDRWDAGPKLTSVATIIEPDYTWMPGWFSGVAPAYRRQIASFVLLNEHWVLASLPETESESLIVVAPVGPRVTQPQTRAVLL